MVTQRSPQSASPSLQLFSGKKRARFYRFFLLISCILFSIVPVLGFDGAYNDEISEDLKGESTYEIHRQRSNDLVKITIMHTNDMHGGGFPTDYLSKNTDRRYGGLFSLATIIQEKRAEIWRKDPARKEQFFSGEKDDGIVLLDAGDSISGTYDDSLSEGTNMAYLMNSSILDYDLATIGNHTSDYGFEPFMMNVSLRNYPVVLSNAKDEETGQHIQGTVPWHVLTVDGVRIGVFAISHDRSTRIEGVKMEGVVKTARKMIPIVRKNADIVVMLSHLGLDKEPKWREGLDKLDDNDPAMNIDIIVDGHSHAKTDYLIDDDTVVAQAGSYAYYAGELNVYYDRKHKRVAVVKARRHELLTEKVEESELLKKTYARLLSRVETENDKVIARGLDGFYFSKTPRDSLIIKNPAAEFVARSMMEVPFADDVEKADIGIVYQKGVRDKVASNDKGEVTNGILHRIVPFGEPVVIVRRTGRQIQDLVKYGLKKKFSWGGLQVTLKEGVQNKQGYRRLVSIKVHDRKKEQMVPLEMNKVYRVAAVGFFCKVFMRPDPADVTTYTITNKEVLYKFLKKYSKHKDRFFTANDPKWPCNIYE